MSTIFRGGGGAPKFLGTAQPWQVLDGARFYSDSKELQMGTMLQQYQHVVVPLRSYVPIPAGYYDGSVYAIENSPNSVVDTASANATAGDISVGKTAYVNGSKITGTNNSPKIKNMIYGTIIGTTTTTIVTLPVTVNSSNCSVEIYSNETYFQSYSFSNTQLIITSSYQTAFRYIIIEYENIKSLQKGFLKGTSYQSTRTVSLTTVNPEKCIVSISVPYGTIAGRSLSGYFGYTAYHTLGATSLILDYRIKSNETVNVCWNVIELN